MYKFRGTTFSYDIFDNYNFQTFYFLIMPNFCRLSITYVLKKYDWYFRFSRKYY